MSGKWNAEFIIDDYGQKIILRPLRDIAQGEQIFAWYGPQYWCDVRHPVELMAKAVITYGVDIDKSTGAPGSQGAWRKLPANTLYKLRTLLKEKGYQAPAEPTTIHANPPTGRVELPTGEELELKDDTPLEIDDHKKRRRSARRQTVKRGRNTTKTHKPTGTERHSASIRDGGTPDDTQRATTIEMDKRSIDIPPSKRNVKPGKGRQGKCTEPYNKRRMHQLGQ